MIDYQVAIPSFKREKTIQTKTLRVLQEHNIPPELVTIFTANEDQQRIYEEALKDHPYGKNIVMGVPTIGAQRNWIEKYYPEGTYLMMFDDDIEEVQRKSGEQDLVPVDDLYKEIIENGFTNCERLGAKTFGIYAAANAYFMKDRVYDKLCYIIASMFGIICDHDTALDRVTNHGEDYEYSLKQYVKNGVLCRLDNYTVKSNYYKEEGGLQDIRTEQYVRDSITIIAEMFPELCTMYTRKSTGMAELKFRDSTGRYKKAEGNTLDAFFG